MTIGIGVAVLQDWPLFFRPLLLTSWPRSGSVHKVWSRSITTHGALDLGFCHCYAECRPSSSLCLHTCCDGLSLMPTASGPWCSFIRLGVSLSILGLFTGYSFNIAVGSCIVLTSAIFFSSSASFIAPKQRKNKHAFIKGETHEKNHLPSPLWRSYSALWPVAQRLFFQSSSDKLKVVTTNSILADITKMRGIKLSSIVLSLHPMNMNHSQKMSKKLLQADHLSTTASTSKLVGHAWLTVGQNANKAENKDYFASDGVEVIYLEGQTKLEKKTLTWLNPKRDYSC